MKKLLRFLKKVGITVFVLAIVSLIGMTINANYQLKSLDAAQAVKPDTREEDINNIITSADFQQQIKDEAEKRYYQDQMKDAQAKLLELQTKGFNNAGERTTALTTFLKGSPLTAYADEIVKLPRWVETVAITGQETNFCSTGVGASKNNCGGVKDSKTGEFKVYKSKLDSIKDVSNIISTTYKDVPVDEMNGHYCVTETKDAYGSPCKDWTENVSTQITKILTK